MKNIDSIYFAARELGPKDRAAYLAKACADDKALRMRVEQMLAVAVEAEAFITDLPDAELEDQKPGHQPAKTPGVDLDDAPAEFVGRKIGRYKVLEQIGEGGCGVVYVAEQTEPVRRRVALKVIKLGMDTKQVVARFEAERQALAMMDHANIAKVLDAGATETGRPFFVMELVRGIKITEYCDQNNLATKARLDLFIKVCQAIQHAHQKGIIHRDIKPSNILVTLHDGVPVPKVIDFGIAKATEGRLTDHTVYTQLQQFIGTPAYMSPEQAEMSGLDIDTRSDIYSLGVLLYELLAGRTPFDAKDLMSQGLDAMRKTIREQEPVRPSTRLAALKGEELTTAAKRRALEAPKLIHLLKGDLDWIVMKCLEKDRTRRYDTANGLAADIKRHLENEPVVARPPSAAYRFQKLVHRNKLAFVASMAIAATLVLGIIVSTAQAIRATRAKREALAAQAQARAAEEEQSRLRIVAHEAQTAAEANAEKFKTSAVHSRRGQYAADMFAATLQMEKGDYLTARNYLREYFPREGQEELRGFEWHYLWQLSAGQQLKSYQITTTGQVVDIAWSPDGRLIAEATWEGKGDGTVELLHADTGEVAAIHTNCTGWNGSVAFSYDGNGLATGRLDYVIYFWDVRDGHLIFSITNDSMPRVTCSPKGPLMAIGTGGDWWAQEGRDVRLVDTSSGKELRVLPKSGDRAVFSPDGKRIATANWGSFNSGSQAVILWDVNSGQKLNVLENMPQVLGMAFSPDGSRLAIGTRQGEVSLWNLNDFSHAILRQATGDFARSVSFSPDGQWLAVGLLTQELEIWDVRERRQAETLRGHTGEVNAVAFSPDGTQLASCSADGTIRLWNPHPSIVPNLIPERQLSYSSQLGRPSFSPDSRWLAIAITNGDVQIVDPTTPDWNVRKVLPHSGFPMRFSSDGATLLTFGYNPNTLRRWNVNSGELLSTTALDSTNSNWKVSTTTLDGNRLALATRGIIRVFETRTGRCLGQILSPEGAETMEFSPDGRWLAVGTGKNGAIWDTVSFSLVQTLPGAKDRVVSIGFSPDQKTVATTSWDHTVRLWETETGKLLVVLTNHKSAVMTCVFSPDGRTLVTGSDDRTIKFWNLATLREISSIQLNAPVYFLTFSPDEKILVANNAELGFRCWRAPSLAEIDAAEAKEKTAVKKP
jgi:WD40 repeat protein/serine/threonine protein kinase